METDKKRENKYEVKEKEDSENTVEVELGEVIVNSIEIESHTEVENLDKLVTCLEILVAKDVIALYTEKPCRDANTGLMYDINNWLSEQPMNWQSFENNYLIWKI